MGAVTNFSPWGAMLASLWDWSGQPSLREWLLGSKPGDELVVLCDSLAEKGNIQSMVNALCRRKGITAKATRTKDGVRVVRL